MTKSVTFHVYKHGTLVENFTSANSTIKIGKLSSSTLHLADESVSRMHAVIENDEGKLTIVDLGSSTGVIVNGSKVSKHHLGLGDEFQIGCFFIGIAGIDSQTVPTRTGRSAKDKLRPTSDSPKGFFSKLFGR